MYLYLEVLIAKSHLSGFVSATLLMLTLTGAPLGYSAVALCHGDPTALGL